MKKLAFATAVIFTAFTCVTPDKKNDFGSDFQQSEIKTQAAVLNDNVNQLAPTVVGRANLAQADGKVIY